MPDDVVQITFNNDTLVDSSGATATITGTIQVDYTTRSVSGNYRASSNSPSNSFNNSYTVSSTNAVANNGGVYTLALNNLSASYSGEQPSSVSSLSYTEPALVIGGVTYAPADTFSGTNQLVTSSPVCFASGTLVSTTQGNVAVEALEVGDIVVTASGDHRAIRWLGHRRTCCQKHPRPGEVNPIRIAAQAFGENRPSRDLFVSPGHAICVDAPDEVLIPAGLLVNGSTIQQVEVAEVTYWHVELDSHDVIVAENLPAESYLDMGNRGFFREADVVDLAAGPDAAPALRTRADFCRPYVDRGPLLDVVRARLAARAEVLETVAERRCA